MSVWRNCYSLIILIPSPSSLYTTNDYCTKFQVYDYGVSHIKRYTSGASFFIPSNHQTVGGITCNLVTQESL